MEDSEWNEKSVGLIETTAVMKVAIVGEGRKEIMGEKRRRCCVVLCCVVCYQYQHYPSICRPSLTSSSLLAVGPNRA